MKTNLWQSNAYVTLGYLHHLSNCNDIPFLLHHRLPDLEIVNNMCELCDDSKNMFLNKISHQIHLLTQSESRTRLSRCKGCEYFESPIILAT